MEEIICPAGKDVVGGGGGGFVVNPNGTFSYSMVLTSSRPVTDAAGTGWQIIFQHPTAAVIPTGSDVRYTVYVLCMTAN